MTKSPENRRLVYALYANAALLLAILVTLVSRGPSGFVQSASGATAPQPIAGNGSLYLMPGQLLNNVWGCYVLDVDSQTLCTYAYNGNQLQLKAARNIRYDHELTNYNTHPDPEEIRKLVELQINQGHGIIPAQAPPQPADAPPTPPAVDK